MSCYSELTPFNHTRVYANEVTWKSPKDGGGLPGELTMGLEGWNLQPHPHLQRGERSKRLNQLMANDLVIMFA